MKLLIKRFTLATVSLFVVTTHLSAQAIVEHFDYTAGQSLTGQNGGTGFSGAWTSAVGTRVNGTIVTGLSFGGLETAGNAVQITISNPTATDAAWEDAKNNVARTLTTLPVVPHYSSFLFNVTARGGNNNLIGVGSGQFGLSEGVLVTGGYGNAAPQGGIRRDFNNNSIGSDLSLATTYFAISKITATGTEAWILTLANYNSWVSAGSLESLLTANSTSSGVRNDPDALFPGPLRIGGYLEVAGISTITFDEIRYGSSLALVTPVPEPSTYALLGLGLVALVFLRYRQKTLP